MGVRSHSAGQRKGIVIMMESDKPFYGKGQERSKKIPDSIKVHSESELRIFPGKSRIPDIPEGAEPYTELDGRRKTKIVPPVRREK